MHSTTFPQRNIESRKETTMAHDSTFDYLKPTDKQMSDMNEARMAAAAYANAIYKVVPDE